LFFCEILTPVKLNPELPTGTTFKTTVIVTMLSLRCNINSACCITTQTFLAFKRFATTPVLCHFDSDACLELACPPKARRRVEGHQERNLNIRFLLSRQVRIVEITKVVVALLYNKKGHIVLIRHLFGGMCPYDITWLLRGPTQRSIWRACPTIYLAGVAAGTGVGSGLCRTPVSLTTRSVKYSL